MVEHPVSVPHRPCCPSCFCCACCTAACCRVDPACERPDGECHTRAAARAVLTGWRGDKGGHPRRRPQHGECRRPAFLCSIFPVCLTPWLGTQLQRFAVLLAHTLIAGGLDTHVSEHKHMSPPTKRPMLWFLHHFRPPAVPRAMASSHSATPRLRSRPCCCSTTTPWGVAPSTWLTPPALLPRRASRHCDRYGSLLTRLAQSVVQDLFPDF